MTSIGNKKILLLANTVEGVMALQMEVTAIQGTGVTGDITLSVFDMTACHQ